MKLQSYFSKFGLKSRYHHIDICQHHQAYLGFAWSAENQPTQLFMFTVLSFGLSSAPYIFTKLIRPLIRHWRDVGINATIFLDDNLDIENSSTLSLEHSNKIKSDLNSLGFVSNDEKSVWVPTQHITWLGLDWNGENGTIAIAAHRLAKLTASLSRILNQTGVTARQLTQVVGQVISIGSVTGNLARIMSRHCQISIAAIPNWESGQATHRAFTLAEQETSSTYRELLATQYVIRALEPLLMGYNIKLLIDS